MIKAENLPHVQGKYTFKCPLNNQVWFRVGGPAEVFFKPQSIEDLSFFLKHLSPSIPWFVLGAGSNILIRDGGIRGVVIKLPASFSTLSVHRELVTVGAGALNRTVALELASKGLSGLEFLIGIPGTIGGSVKMNAGCYNSEIKDNLLSVKIIDAKSQVITLEKKDLSFAYRQSFFPEKSLIVEATFQCTHRQPDLILKDLDQIMKQRENSQPLRTKTGGSTFKNPANQKAWELIDQAGCRGLKLGDAQVSEKHCNFLINTGSATAKDLENLGCLVQEKVLKKSGIMLEWEIHRVGSKQL